MPKYPIPPLRRIREAWVVNGKKVTQEFIAARAEPPTSGAQVSRLEAGDRLLDLDWAEMLAPAFHNIEPEQLMFGGDKKVPVTIAVCSVFAEHAPDNPDLPRPFEMFTVRKPLDRPFDWFAAEVYDDTANTRWRRGSVLLCRHLDALRRPLQRMDKVVIRRFRGTRAEGQTMEYLAGILGVTELGDIVCNMLTDDNDLRGHRLIQSPDQGDTVGLSDAALAFRARSVNGVIDYAPRDDDPTEIIGVVERAMVEETLVAIED